MKIPLTEQCKFLDMNTISIHHFVIWKKKCLVIISRYILKVIKAEKHKHRNFHNGLYTMKEKFTINMNLQ